MKFNQPRKFSIKNINKCFSCKWCIQTPNCMQCSHPNKITYLKLDKPCECGRKDPLNEWLEYWDHLNQTDETKEFQPRACGRCTGRGEYCYPFLYDNCDCGGFEYK
jgi:hypothetical protein